MKGLQRIISGMLAVCLLISMMPVSVLAAEVETAGETVLETTVFETQAAVAETTEPHVLETVPEQPTETVAVDVPSTEENCEQAEAPETVCTEPETEPDEPEEIHIAFDIDAVPDASSGNYFDETYEGTMYVSGNSGYGPVFEFTLAKYSMVTIEMAVTSPNGSDFMLIRKNPAEKMTADYYLRTYYDGTYGYGRYRTFSLPVGEYKLSLYPDVQYDSIVKYWIRIQMSELSHTCSYRSEVTEPTCTTGGYTKETCTLCGRTWTGYYTDPLGHDEIPTARIPATCTKPGKTEGTKCSRCSLVMQAPSEIPMLPHTPAAASDIPPTCVEDGKQDVTVCSACGNFLDYTVVPNLGGHVYTEYGNRVCYRCGSVDDEDLLDYGTCGDSVMWFMEKGYILRIEGVGDMYDYADQLEVPWNSNMVQLVYIAEGVTSISSYAFGTSLDLVHVSIPESVWRIGDGAFFGSNIERIEIPAGVREIGDEAFYGCDELSNLTLSEGLQEIGAFAFKGCKQLTELRIPDTVTTLGEGCFSGCSKIAEVTVGKNVTAIPDDAFNGCSKLDYVSFLSGGNLNAIGDYAFFGCKLTSLTLPYGVREIGESAFEEQLFWSVTLPSTLKTVGFAAFMNCGSLRDVYFGGTSSQWNSILISGGNSSLNSANITYGSYGYTGDIKWSVEGNTLIFSGSGRMLDYGSTGTRLWAADCEYVTKVVVGETVSYLGNYIFNGCSNIKSIHIKGQAPEIGSNAFAGVTATVYYEPGDSWASVVGNQYGGTITWAADCSKGHTIVTVPGTPPTCTESGLSDGRECSGCGLVFSTQQVLPARGHTPVTDPAVEPTCTQPGYTEGSHCASCNAVLVETRTLAAKGHTEVVDKAVAATCTKSGLTEGKHCSTCDQVLIAQTEIPAKGHTQMVDRYVAPTCTESGLTEGSHCSVCKAVLVAQTTIPATGHDYVDYVCRICGLGQLLEGTGADDLYWKLDQNGTLTITGSGEMWDTPWEDHVQRIKAVEIGEGITSVGYVSFEDCVNLTEVFIPFTVRIIESSAFAGCTSLTEIVIPHGVTVLETSAFEGCTSLASIVLPTTLTEIEASVFRKCTGLTSVVIPEGVTTMGYGVFRYCSALTTVSLPGSLTSVGMDLFAGCTSLSTVNIPAKLTELSRFMFSGCSSLTSVVIPDKVKTIGDSAFSGCSSLTSVTIPASVTNIGEAVFSGCSALTEIKVNSSNAMYSSDSHGVLFDKKKTTLICIPGGFTGSYTVPEKVTALGNDAAGYCTGLTQITLPRSLASIGNYAFYKCTGLTDVWFLGGAPVMEADIFSGLTLTARYPAGEASWTEEIRQYCGGNVTWVASCVNGHAEVIQPAVPAACTESGLTEGKYCSVCGDVLVKQEAVPALGHRDVIDPAVDATCTAPGLTAGRHCSACALVFEAQTVIPALGHREVVEPAVAPTCTVSGVTERIYCEVCHNVIKIREHIAANGHSFENGLCIICGAEDKGDYTVISGKSSALQIVNPATGTICTAKQVTWAMDEMYAPFAKIDKNGKITAKKVVERVRVEALGTIMDSKNTTVTVLVDIFPAATYLELQESGGAANNKTLNVNFTDEPLVLTANVHPLDAMQGVIWTISDKKGEFASYTIDEETASLTVDPREGAKAGTVTVKATTTDGSKKTATVKLQFGTYAKTVTIDKSITTLTAGDKAVQLTATVTPNVVTKSGIVWSLKDPADKNYANLSSSGKLTPKAVLAPVDVTVVATSKDGMAKAEHTIRILPQNTAQLVIKSGNTYVTKTTQTLDVNTRESITLTAHTYGETGMMAVEWTPLTNKAANFIRNPDGSLTVQMIAAGSITVTAKTADGRKATVTVKGVKLAQGIEIAQKKTGITEGLEVASGKSLDLEAVLTDAASKKVTWTVVKGDAYGTVSSSGKFTAAKDLTSAQTVTVRATAADGSGIFDDMEITVRPIAQGVQIYSEAGGQMLFSFRTASWYVRSNTTLVWDLSRQETAIAMDARVYPYYGEDSSRNAIQGVTWKSSAPKVANIVDGVLEIYKTGSVTVTATANDGSGQKVSFKLNVVKTVTELIIADQTVQGDKSLNLAKLVTVNPGDATNKKLTWTIVSGGNYATVSTSGSFKAKKVTQPQTVEVKVSSQDGGASTIFTVTIKP